MTLSLGVCIKSNLLFDMSNFIMDNAGRPQVSKLSMVSIIQLRHVLSATFWYQITAKVILPYLLWISYLVSLEQMWSENWNCFRQHTNCISKMLVTISIQESLFYFYFFFSLISQFCWISFVMSGEAEKMICLSKCNL